MPANPLPAPVGAAEAAARPQLRLAARTGSHTDPEITTIAAGVEEVVGRSHVQWRGTLDSVKETLATLERDCESAIEAQEAGVAGLIDTLVGKATAEAEAAAQQARAEAQIEIAGLQAEREELRRTVDALQANLQVEQDKRAAAQEQLELEFAARVRVEAKNEAAARAHQQRMAEAEAQIHKLRAETNDRKSELALVNQQLAAAKADSAKLLRTFQSLQRVLSNEQSETPASDNAAEPGSFPPAEPEAAGIEAPPEALQDIAQILTQIEDMHTADLNSGLLPMAVVDALTANLRYARETIISRSPLDPAHAEALFDQQLDVVLEVNAGSAFGRHLSIAAYAAARLMGVPPE